MATRRKLPLAELYEYDVFAELASSNATAPLARPAPKSGVGGFAFHFGRCFLALVYGFAKFHGVFHRFGRGQDLFFDACGFTFYNF